MKLNILQITLLSIILSLKFISENITLKFTGGRGHHNILKSCLNNVFIKNVVRTICNMRSIILKELIITVNKPYMATDDVTKGLLTKKHSFWHSNSNSIRKTILLVAPTTITWWQWGILCWVETVIFTKAAKWAKVFVGLTWIPTHFWWKGCLFYCTLFQSSIRQVLLIWCISTYYE